MDQITLKVRCTAKNLGGGMMPPPAGGAPAPGETVSAQFTVAESSIAGMTGSMSFNYVLAVDAFQIGEYYDLTMAGGAAPAQKFTRDAPGAKA